jgi:hypothetical protein
MARRHGADEAWAGGFETEKGGGGIYFREIKLWEGFVGDLNSIKAAFTASFHRRVEREAKMVGFAASEKCSIFARRIMLIEWAFSHGA